MSAQAHTAHDTIQWRVEHITHVRKLNTILICAVSILCQGQASHSPIVMLLVDRFRANSPHSRTRARLSSSNELFFFSIRDLVCARAPQICETLKFIGHTELNIGIQSWGRRQRQRRSMSLSFLLLFTFRNSMELIWNSFSQAFILTGDETMHSHWKVWVIIIWVKRWGLNGCLIFGCSRAMESVMQLRFDQLIINNWCVLNNNNPTGSGFIHAIKIHR